MHCQLLPAAASSTTIFVSICTRNPSTSRTHSPLGTQTSRKTRAGNGHRWENREFTQQGVEESIFERCDTGDVLLFSRNALEPNPFKLAAIKLTKYLPRTDACTVHVRGKMSTPCSLTMGVPDSSPSAMSTTLA